MSYVKLNILELVQQKTGSEKKADNINFISYGCRVHRATAESWLYDPELTYIEFKNLKKLTDLLGVGIEEIVVKK